MLRSNISEALFNRFTSNYQTFSNFYDSQKPFVYVDHEGNIKLLTNIVENDLNCNDGIFAVSVAQNGWMEFLAFNEV